MGIEKSSASPKAFEEVAILIGGSGKPEKKN
jgi:hypothetical protein